MTIAKKEMFPFPIIRKRDGRMTRFDIDKIGDAIHRAFYACGTEQEEKCRNLAGMVVEDLHKTVEGNVPHVEEIQDSVERILIREGHAREAKAFILYRAKRTSIREGKSELMDSVDSILRETHRTTSGALNSPSAKMLKIASAASRSFYLTRLIPSQFADAHIRGDIHIHDLDYYGKTLSSLQIPLKRILEGGFNSGCGYIRPPRRYSSLMALVAIIIQACQNDLYGGQSIPEFDAQVAGYARDHLSAEARDNIPELFQATEGLVYNLNMIYSRMGAQVPTSTINLGLDTTPGGRHVAMALLEAVKRGMGRGETPLYPWIIFCLKDGVNMKPGDPNFDLYQKAVDVSRRRMNPSFAFMDAPINRDCDSVAYWGDGARVTQDMSGVYRSEGNLADQREWGWGNVAHVTVNLPRIAFKVAHKRKDFQLESFHNELRRTLDLCVRQLVHRRDVLASLTPMELPFVMGGKIYRGSSTLAGDESIMPVLKYGIFNIGFVGLAEAIYILHGRHHGEDSRELQFAGDTVDFMNQTLENLSREFECKFVLSASSSGYASLRFPQLDRIEYGITPRVNDKKYYHQGFSLPGSDNIPWKERLEIEGKLHSLIPGGHFTYLESSRMPTEEQYFEVLDHMARSGIALGGISFPLHENLDQTESDDVMDTDTSGSDRIRCIQRAAGLMLPLDRINEALGQEIKNRVPDL